MIKTVLIALAIAVAPLATPQVQAQEAKEIPTKPQKPKTKKVDVVSKKTYKKLTTIQEAMEANDSDTVAATLNDLQSRMDKLNPYEQFLVWQLTAGMEADKERYDKAAQAFEKALATKGFPAGADTNIIYNLAQIYMVTGDFTSAIQRFETWISLTDKPGADAYSKLASAYAQIEDYKNGQTNIFKAIALAGAKAKEVWYNMAIGMTYELGDTTKTIDLLETVLETFPSKRDYWMQLTGLYLDQKREKEALATLQIAHKAGFLTKSSEYIQVAQWLLYYEAPYFSGKFLEQALKDGKAEPTKDNYELLSNAWLSAREYAKAIKPLTIAAEKADDGELYVRLGQTYFQDKDWSQSITALNKGLTKGKLKDTGQAWLLLGIASMNSDNKQQATKAFTNATKYKQTKETATKWLEYIKDT